MREDVASASPPWEWSFLSHAGPSTETNRKWHTCPLSLLCLAAVRSGSAQDEWAIRSRRIRYLPNAGPVDSRSSTRASKKAAVCRTSILVKPSALDDSSPNASSQIRAVAGGAGDARLEGSVAKGCRGSGINITATSAFPLRNNIFQPTSLPRKIQTNLRNITFHKNILRSETPQFKSSLRHLSSKWVSPCTSSPRHCVPLRSTHLSTVTNALSLLCTISSMQLLQLQRLVRMPVWWLPLWMWVFFDPSPISWHGCVKPFEIILSDARCRNLNIMDEIIDVEGVVGERKLNGGKGRGMSGIMNGIWWWWGTWFYACLWSLCDMFTRRAKNFAYESHVSSFVLDKFQRVPFIIHWTVRSLATNLLVTVNWPIKNFRLQPKDFSWALPPKAIY